MDGRITLSDEIRNRTPLSEAEILEVVKLAVVMLRRHGEGSYHLRVQGGEAVMLRKDTVRQRVKLSGGQNGNP